MHFSASPPCGTGRRRRGVGILEARGSLQGEAHGASHLPAAHPTPSAATTTPATSSSADAGV